MKKEMMTMMMMMRTTNDGGGRVPPVHGYGRVKLGDVRQLLATGNHFDSIKHC
jgi:hypothetical protein